MHNPALILLVDDEKDLLEIASIKLQASGYAVATAYNAREAIDAATKLHPDLILMDIRMPGESGTDAALEIKQTPELKDTKIVFLSSLKDPWPAVGGERDNLAKELGMDDFIDKTGDLNVMVAKVKEVLARA
jgi:two-component system alkaline phosphatase synthesis response regulator PhoP